MTENELYLDVLVGKRSDGSNIYVRDLLVEVQSARGAALEEAARALGLDLDAPFTAPLGCCPLYGTDHDTCRHDAAASQPARRYLDAEDVEKVLTDLRAYGHAREVEAISTQQSHVGGRSVAWAVEQAAERLGLDLDAAPKPTQPREYATVENGLLPAPRKS